ncbi:Transcriptional regulator, LysR family [plant metagenome]|uniref:Transcriptional regulator, LysR family n=1 Tax=plant metagenome TaxID=1297885 RepID=A0A484U869_9ZZZZ
MRRRLPPLATLRPFEATARLGSFTLAAQELSLTQGAVSQQVRNLEDFLGLKLFERQARRLDLTDEGRQLFASVQRALDDLERTVGRLVVRGERVVLNVTAMPTLATVWLMPRLAAFAALHPDIELRLATSIEPADLHGGNVDVAIRVGKLPGRAYPREHANIDLVMTERWDGVIADSLFPDAIVPVASRALLAEGARIEGPSDLQAYPLIHTVSRQRAWPDWFRAQGVRFHPRLTDPECGHFFISLQAAREGRGIAMVPELIFHHAREQSEDLVAAWLPAARSAGEYYVLTHETQETSRAVQAFRQWLVEEGARTRAAHGMADAPVA